jgi:long-chain acyl-CoA synthetase
VALHEDATVTTGELKDFLRERLSKIEMPKAIEIRDSLPKTMIGKLSKKELVEEENKKLA